MAFPRAIPALVLLLTLTASACTFEVSSGESVTTSYDVESFDAIKVANAIEVIVSVGEEQSVEIEVDESAEDELEVEVKDGTLNINYSSSVITLNSAPTVARIQVPALTAVELSGATSMEIYDLAAKEFTVEVEGASSLDVNGEIDDLVVDINGASSVDFDDATVKEASIDVNGASSLDITSAESVTGSASGASSVTVDDDATVDVESSGASSVDRS